MPRNKSYMRGKAPTTKKPPLTHFLCVPLVTANSRPRLETTIEQFRNEVLTGSNDASSQEQRNHPVRSDQQPRVQGVEVGRISVTPSTKIHPKSIRPVGTLHCTLGVMSLNEGQLKQAVALLQSLDMATLLSDSASEKTTVETTPASTSDTLQTTAAHLSVELKGLVSMHAPTKTSILYTTPNDPSERLYSFCEALQMQFKEKGFMTNDDRPLKLHATIINTIYAKGRNKPRKSPQTGVSVNGSQESSIAGEDRSQGHGPDADAPLKIDASVLLDQYRDYVWAENVVLDRIAICEMGAKKRLDAAGNVIDEEYTEVASVILPS